MGLRSGKEKELLDQERERINFEEERFVRLVCWDLWNSFFLLMTVPISWHFLFIRFRIGISLDRFLNLIKYKRRFSDNVQKRKESN
jgi:hypothetical protein